MLTIGDIRALGTGLFWTVSISAISIILGTLVGLTIAFMLLSKRVTFRIFAGVYRSFWRGTPLLVQLFIVFFLLPKIGVDVPPVAAAIIALTMNTGAFQAEIYRGGLMAIPKGQIEAARMLGIRTGSLRQRILIPQMFQLVMPSLINETISILKNSSLISVIAVTELMRTSQQISAVNFRPLETYLVAGALYILLNACLAWAGSWFEQKLAISARTVQ